MTTLKVLNADSTPLRKLKCIHSSSTVNGGDEFRDTISFNQFETSFIKERWQGERRNDTRTTIFGRCHHRTIVNSPHGRSVRDFDFPSSVEEAKKRHNEFYGFVTLDGLETTKETIQNFLDSANWKISMDDFLKLNSKDGLVKWLESGANE